MLQTADKVFEILRKPFSPEDIEWRIGRKNKDKTKAEVLAYVTARAVMERFDEAVGPENWSVHYETVDMGQAGNLDRMGNKKDLKGFLCTIEIRLARSEESDYCDYIIVSREDVSQCTDVEPLKGGASGAMKRAAVQFGVGRYLYKLKSNWVNIDQYGNFKVPKLPDWALPEGYVYATEMEAEPTADEWDEVPVPHDGPVSAPTDGDIEITFGKYNGKRLSEIGETDAKYVQWLANNANKDYVKNAALAWVNSHSQAMAGNAPW